MKMEHVDGRKTKYIVLYALSTCIWCKKMKKFLDEKGVEYYFAYVDMMCDEEKKDTMQEIEKWNPELSFPAVVIDNAACVVGYKPSEIEKMLGA